MCLSVGNNSCFKSYLPNNFAYECHKNQCHAKKLELGTDQLGLLFLLLIFEFFFCVLPLGLPHLGGGGGLGGYMQAHYVVFVIFLYLCNDLYAG